MISKNELVDIICGSQSASGAFKSKVHLPFGDFDDDNAFLTALVLRHTRKTGIMEELPDVTRRAHTFLRRCESDIVPGVFGFWPDDGYPAWMKKTRLYKDADDSAITALEFVRGGIEEMGYLENVAKNALARCRFFSSQLDGSDWRRSGVFLTWLSQDARPNPVDCCVNTNVIAMLSYCGLEDMPGYREACEMITDAIQRSGGEEKKVAELVPYYPHPIELFYALQHAVETGVSGLRAGLEYLAPLPWVRRCLEYSPGQLLPMCANPEGTIYWTSEAVRAARIYSGVNIPREF